MTRYSQTSMCKTNIKCYISDLIESHPCSTYTGTTTYNAKQCAFLIRVHLGDWESLLLLWEAKYTEVNLETCVLLDVCYQRASDKAKAEMQMEV